MSGARELLWWYAIGWALLILFVAHMTLRRGRLTVGLPLAYVMSSTFLYIGFLTYLVPDYTHNRPSGSQYVKDLRYSEHTVLLGTEATLLGLMAFAVGVLLTRLIAERSDRQNFPPLSAHVRQRMMLSLGVFGLAGFLLTTLHLDIPLMQALLQVGRNAAIATVCLGAALSAYVDRSSGSWRWLMVAIAIPAFFIVVWGFASYGFIVGMIFIGFWLSSMPHARIGLPAFALSAAASCYALLTLFIGWMSFRFQLRFAISSGASIEDRLNLIIEAIGKIDWLSPSNFASLDILNTRLNQYVFVGKMMEWHEKFPTLQLLGETLAYAPLAWVPRFMWPGKPEMGGSSFVAEHTGMKLSSESTFGAGPIFEFYANFGYPGIIIGMIILGVVVGLLDRRAARALTSGQYFNFALWFTIGIAFIAPLTDVFFMVNTAVMSWFVMLAMRRYSMSAQHSMPSQPVPPRTNRATFP